MFSNCFSNIKCTLLIHEVCLVRERGCNSTTLCKLFGSFNNFLEFEWIWAKSGWRTTQFTRVNNIFEVIQDGVIQLSTIRWCILFKWSQTARLLNLTYACRVRSVRETISAMVLFNYVLTLRACLFSWVWTNKISWLPFDHITHQSSNAHCERGNCGCAPEILW